MQGQLNLSVRAFSKRLILKLQLFEGHIREHFLVRIGLTCHSELPSLDERCRLLDPFDLNWVKRGDYMASECVFAPLTLVLVPHLPILVEAMVRTVYQRCDWLIFSGLHLPVNYVGDVR